MVLIRPSFSLFLFSGCFGCGENCVEIPTCGSANVGSDSVAYLSLPMCGGCFTYGCGCGSCLYPQKCTLSFGADDYGDAVIHLDNIYYGGDSCTGCGDTLEERWYVGCIKGKYDGESVLLGYDGSNPGSARIYGIVSNGCVCLPQEESDYMAHVGDAIQQYADEGTPSSNYFSPLS